MPSVASGDAVIVSTCFELSLVLCYWICQYVVVIVEGTKGCQIVL